MAANENHQKDVLLADFQFHAKAFELQFNHFMGAFYFWSAVIAAPTTAAILTNLGLQNSAKFIAYGVLCLLVYLLGTFLSVKMFDIRRSQLRYAGKMNVIRSYLWRRYKIKDSFREVLKDVVDADLLDVEICPTGETPKGRLVDLMSQARSDFGGKMAWTMALAHGAIATAGGFFLSYPLVGTWWTVFPAMIVGLGLGAVTLWYYFFVFFPCKSK